MGNCPRCGFKKWLKTERFDEQGLRFYKCGRCEEPQLGDKPFRRSLARILYFDIETSLSEYYNFGPQVRGGWMSYKYLKKPFYTICWTAQVVGTDEVYTDCVTQRESLRMSDKRILKSLRVLMDGADIIAGHNVKFDISSVTGRMMKHKFEPLSPFKIYDTYRMAKQHKFESYSLDYLCSYFGLPKKRQMTAGDWIKINATGNPKALKKMHVYNQGDVANGVSILNIFLKWDNMKKKKPAEYGMRQFQNEPKWKVTE